MYCLPLVIAFCLAQTEGVHNQLPSRTSRVPPDYTEALPPKKFLQNTHRRNRRMLLGSNHGGGGDDRKPGTESLEDSFDQQMFRRRTGKKGDAWEWDTYCQLQPQYGNNCDKPQKKYYYDRQLDSCLPFQYTGCKKNKNHFKNLWECEGYCKGAAYSDVVGRKLDAKIICALQIDAGRCLAYFQSYYFDINTGTCKKFGYGGCGGNQNQFKTQSACSELCKHTLRKEAEDDKDSGETDLSTESDSDVPEQIEASTALSAVKRAKKKKHEGSKIKNVGDISRSNEGFMAKSKQGTSKGKLRFSEQSNTMKNSNVDNAQNIHEGFVTTKSSGVKNGKGRSWSREAFSGSGANIGKHEDVTAKSRSKEALDRNVKDFEATKTTPEKDDGDSMSIFKFSGSGENIGKHEDVTAKSRSKEALDRLSKDFEATKTTPAKDDGNSKSIITSSGSGENIGKHEEVTAKSRSKEALDRIVKDFEATQTTPTKDDGDSMSIITFSGSGENIGKHKEVTAKSRSKEALDRIVKDFEATKTTPAHESDELSVITFSAAQPDLEKENKKTVANARSGSNEIVDNQDADPKSVIIQSHSAEIISGNPNITISIQDDLDESSGSVHASNIKI